MSHLCDNTVAGPAIRRDNRRFSNVPWRKRALGPGTKYGFLRRIFGHSWGLVYGEGGAPGTVPLHNLRVTSHVLHQEVPLGWYRVRLF